MILIAATNLAQEGSPGSTRRSSRAGFSLIEVLAALAIFLISLVAIGRLVDMGIDRQVEAQFQVRGARLAQGKMAEVISGSETQGQTPTSSSGKFDNDPEWSYTVNASLYPGSSSPNLYLVQVTVTRDNRGQPFNFDLNQIVFNPSQLGSAQPATATTDQGSATPPPGSGATAPATTGTGTTTGGTP